LSSRAFSLRDCWVTVLISSSCHNNIIKLYASGRTQVVMDTPIRWKVKRRFKEVRLSVLLAFLMFVTSRVSAGKRRISCSQTVTLCRGPRSPGAAVLLRERIPRSVRRPGTGMTGGGDGAWGGPRVRFSRLKFSGFDFCSALCLCVSIRAATNNGMREVFPCKATDA